ncbi:hypothetical protein [Alkalibacillus aidingensis]|uniref:hypothetical protein n=1 Tax=Alkalibacillus aidingensis TaxID=2747607 RepID=UPI00166098CE|nr:hypothetical protein [Alkalibacillus aidingensis]
MNDGMNENNQNNQNTQNNNQSQGQSNLIPNELQGVSNKVIDLLVDTTLKKHNVNLESNQLDEDTKQQLRELVEELQKSVESLQNNQNNND